MKEVEFSRKDLILGRAIAQDEAQGPYDFVTQRSYGSVAYRLRHMSLRDSRASFNWHKSIIEERAYMEDMEGLFSWDPCTLAEKVEW